MRKLLPRVTHAWLLGHYQLRIFGSACHSFSERLFAWAEDFWLREGISGSRRKVEHSVDTFATADFFLYFLAGIKTKWLSRRVPVSHSLSPFQPLRSFVDGISSNEDYCEAQCA